MTNAQFTVRLLPGQFHFRFFRITPEQGQGLANGLDLFRATVIAQLLDYCLPGVTIIPGDFDFYQLVMVQRYVQFIHHVIGDAMLADTDHRLQVMGKIAAMF
jgi:hypothetical protein